MASRETRRTGHSGQDPSEGADPSWPSELRVWTRSWPFSAGPPFSACGSSSRASGPRLSWREAPRAARRLVPLSLGPQGTKGSKQVVPTRAPTRALKCPSQNARGARRAAQQCRGSEPAEQSAEAGPPAGPPAGPAPRTHRRPFCTTRFRQLLQQEQAWLHSKSKGGSAMLNSGSSRPSWGQTAVRAEQGSPRQPSRTSTDGGATAPSRASPQGDALDAPRSSNGLCLFGNLDNS